MHDTEVIPFVRNKSAGILDYKIFIVLFSVNFLITLSFGMLNTFLPIFLTENGYSSVMLGAVVSSYWLSKFFFSAVMGFLVDFVHRKWSMAISLILFVLLSLFCFEIHNFAAIFIARLIQGILFALFQPLIFSILCDSIDIDKAASAMGTFDISFYSAVCISPFLGGLVKESFGYYGMCNLILILTVCSVLLWLLVGKSGQRHSQQISKCINKFKVTDVNFRLSALCLFLFNKGFMTSMMITVTPIMLAVKYNLNPSAIGIILSLSSISMIVFLRIAGRLAELINVQTLMIIGSMLVSLLYFVIPNIPVKAMIYIFILTGIFNATSQPASKSVLVIEGNKIGQGFANGVSNTCMSLGLMLGPVAGSSIISKSNFENAYYFTGILSIVLLVASTLLFKLADRFSS
ncbi:MFS transporter [Seleniivibrio sp.]|uniref:MFS transporter n=1 Tax=Seleniivibrio sp. TaxID=2898801 RepID=UPI000E921671|nr:MFS transporter [Seleniivibrio sp.]MCD8553586.1 MFS transporter [Seleniivibrio sp.]HAW57790.1 hypothetical protein [Bacteroidales bacterium]